MRNYLLPLQHRLAHPGCGDKGRKGDFPSRMTFDSFQWEIDEESEALSGLFQNNDRFRDSLPFQSQAVGQPDQWHNFAVMNRDPFHIPGNKGNF